MKNQLKGIGRVFSFTLVQQMKTKAWRVSTILLAALLFLLPAGIMTLAELLGNKEGSIETEPGIVIENEQDSTLLPVEMVYVVDYTGASAEDFTVMNQALDVDRREISWEDCSDDLEAAVKLANKDPHSLILVVDKEYGEYELTVLLPENSLLGETEAYDFESFLYSSFYLVLMERSGLNAVQMFGASQGTSVDMVTESAEIIDEPIDEMEDFKMIISMILSFFVIMLLYFLVLFYGQGVANCVIVEKTSKLMDTFLVSVKPGAMIFGKVFAVVAASSIQFMIWIMSVIGGFAAGTMLVRMINPESDMLILMLFDSLSVFQSMFSISGIVLGVLMVLAGFLLYCSLAAIGGSIAGKPEDLSSTNMLFTMALVISFLAAMYGGGIEGLDMGFGTQGNDVLHWIPFTAILVAPAKLMLGDISAAVGIGSLSIVLLTCVLILAGAGRLYHMMALYKGSVPSPAKLIKMFKQK